VAPLRGGGLEQDETCHNGFGALRTNCWRLALLLMLVACGFSFLSEQRCVRVFLRCDGGGVGLVVSWVSERQRSWVRARRYEEAKRSRRS